MLSLIPSDSGTIQLLEGDNLLIAAAQGFKKEILQTGLNLSVQNFPLNKRVMETMRPVFINNARQDA
jgi:hypothetical protein